MLSCLCFRFFDFLRFLTDQETRYRPYSCRDALGLARVRLRHISALTERNDVRVGGNHMGEFWARVARESCSLPVSSLARNCVRYVFSGSKSSSRT